MRQKHNFIEINGQRYDASTGVPLSHTGTKQKSSQPAPVSVPVQVVEPAKPISRPEPQTGHSRDKAKDLRGHAPQPTRTLMRQAVRKPEPAKRAVRIKATGQLNAPSKGAAVVVKPSVSRLDAARLHHAEHIKRSHLISRFSRRQITADPEFVTTTTSVTVSASTTAPVAQPATPKGKRPKTTADVLEMAIQNATSHLQPPVKPERRHRVWHRRHAAAH